MNKKNIRNFSIIAHIDHGKTTLSDRLIQKSDMFYKIKQDNKEAQLLDSMDLEKERGITIKSHPIRLEFDIDGEHFLYNIIDTPGHVDFSYEVSRSLAACEGAILLVDAAQGVEAQTVANTYLAIESDLEIIPVANKIDMQQANVPETIAEIHELIGCDENEIILASAKSGKGVDDILRRVRDVILPPSGDDSKPLKALIFDSHFDMYKGVISHIRVFDGVLKKGMKILFMANNETFEVMDVGVFKMGMVECSELSAGEVGYFTALIRKPQIVHVGDTVTNAKNQTAKAFPGYRKSLPMVFSGIYPINPNDYAKLKDSLEKLRLNDPSFQYVPESSDALGYGFRAGYLGLLHMEVVNERLLREYEIQLINTAPSVAYRVILRNGKTVVVENPSKFPDPSQIKSIEEPIVQASIVTPPEYIGSIMEISQNKRGRYQNMEYISENRVILKYFYPLSEIVIDFYDQLKSVSRGYASLDYGISGYQEEKIVLVRILVNSSPVDALSFMCVKDQAHYKGKSILQKLRKTIPRQMFNVALQAAVGGKIISRENIVQLRKDVIAKCYGGDITRKRKLLEKQKAGKKRMKMVGNVEIPQEAFLTVLKI
ncbi:MAG: translation elongation factor 4 [Caldisericia bacterium]|nr:translation elongation factor 4 [Caldisericia bacterium]